MKLLWVNPNYLHPTTKGGQIRTLEMLRRLHARHEVHYATFADPHNTEGPSRAREYASRLHTVPHRTVSRTSPRFALQVVGGLFSDVPVAVSRHYSPRLKHELSELIARERFDAIVCDFLASVPHIADMGRALLFQHNVETMIWRRHAENSSGIKRAYFELQANRMFEYERQACRAAASVVAVSQEDATLMKEMFGVSATAVPTGVDLAYFARPRERETVKYDLVFVGSMDWLPNIDGVRWFHQQILPLIRRHRPNCSVVIAGRSPDASIAALAEADPLIRVTGTVADIRPFLWESAVSIVPLRIGGGTRLKIYESVAAGTPVVSTRVGAEGLPLDDGKHIVFGDAPEAFAERCLQLLSDADRRSTLAAQALDFVANRFSWESVTAEFERCIRSTVSA